MPTKLRKRLTSARSHMTNLSQPHKRTLEPSTLLKYSEKLLPLLSDEFLQGLGTDDDALPLMKTSRFMLNHALSAPIMSVTNLTVQPGESGFVLWLIVSSYFPLVSACMAPVSNLISLVCLIEKWGYVELSLVRLDNSSVFALNVLSFIFGVMGNASLVLNFSQRMHYLFSQLLSISCWLLAGLFLLVAVIMAAVKVASIDEPVQLTEGYYLAMFTVFFYYSCAIIQASNFLGYTLKKYPPVFNLSRRQRSLMMYILCFCLWEVAGTVSMAYLLSDATFGMSLYFCTVSILTIGYGDLVPETPGARAFDMVFCFVGVIIVGLVVAMIRQVVLTSAAPCIFWHRIELGRKKLIQRLEKEDIRLSPEEAFSQMRQLRREVKLHQANLSLLATIIVFVVFWLVGGLIFCYIEDWNYFDGVYYCFVTLLTIGYGDFTPQKPLGRSFFIVWAFFAVPLMAILISNASDTLFEWGEKINAVTTHLMHWRTYWGLLKAFYQRWIPHRNDISPSGGLSEMSSLLRSRSFARSHSGLITLDAAELEEREVGPLTAERLRELHTSVNDDYEIIANVVNRIESLKVLLVDSVETPAKRYTHDEWVEHLDALNTTQTCGEDADFWIGEQSPLRLPIKEPSFLLLKMLVGVENDVMSLLQSQEKLIEGLRRFCYEHGVNPDEQGGNSVIDFSDLPHPERHPLSLYLESKGLSPETDLVKE